MSEVTQPAAAPVPTQAPAAVPSPAPQVDPNTAVAVAKPAESAPEPTAAVTPPEVAKPVEYSLTLPEDSVLDKARLDEIVSFAKERGLSAENAQAIVERENSAAKTHVESLVKQHNHNVETLWPESVKNDKEIGGANYAKSVEMSHRVLSKFGSKEFADELNRTGYGNHPELVRVFSRIGKAMSEDQLFVPSAVKPPQQSIADIFYPNMKKE